MGNLMTIQPSLHTRAYRCYSPAARPPRDGPCSYRTFRKTPSHRRGHWLGNRRTYFCCKKEFFENVKICNIYTYLKYNFWFKKAWSKILNISKYVTFFSHKISVLQFRPSLAVDVYSTNEVLILVEDIIHLVIITWSFQCNWKWVLYLYCLWLRMSLENY